VLNNTGPYVQGWPTDIQGIYNVTGFGTGWGTVHVFGTTSPTDVPPLPDELNLPAVLALAAAPNPSQVTTSIRFELPTAGPVSLNVYDAAGRLVRTLARESFTAGRYVRTWDGATNSGVRAAAGVYFLKLAAPGGSLKRTIVRID